MKPFMFCSSENNKAPRNIVSRRFVFVGEPGIEPGPHGPKPRTLPLCYTPETVWETVSVECNTHSKDYSSPILYGLLHPKIQPAHTTLISSKSAKYTITHQKMRAAKLKKVVSVKTLLREANFIKCFQNI